MFRQADLSAGARTLRLLDALTGQPQGRTLAELADELGVSESTIKRDLAHFDAGGIEVERILIGSRAAARLGGERHRLLLLITRRERYTLLATRRLFDVFAGTSLAEDVNSLLEKLAPASTTEERSQIASDRACFAYVPEGGTKFYRGKDDVLDALLTGILKRRLIEYVYKRGSGGTKKGLLAPLAMVMFKQGLYVIGRTLSEPSAQMRSEDEGFAVERFSAADVVRRSSFDVPSDFNLDDKLVSSFELPVGNPKSAKRVVVEFTKERAAYARAREWHKYQTLQELPDGSVILSFTCNNLDSIASWVHQWGPQAYVLEPPELVEIMEREIAETGRGYEARRATRIKTSATKRAPRSE